MVEKDYGYIEYIPVGYITPDTNVLRQHLWSYHSLKKYTIGMLFRWSLIEKLLCFII